MTYREFAAPPDLTDTVRCIWAFDAELAVASDERIVPDGSPELIVHLGVPYLELGAAGQMARQPAALLAGNLTRPLVLRGAGRVSVFGVRLWPHVVARFVDTPVAATIDRRIALAPARRIRAHLRKQAAAARPGEPWPATAVQAQGAARFLMETLTRAPFQPDAGVAWGVAEIYRSRGLLSLDALANGLSISRRQLERRMRVATGLSPKQLASIVQFRAVFDEMQAGATSPWLQAALAAGYFDQAHLIRTFRRLVGCAPRAYLQSAGVLSAALVASQPQA